MVQQQPLARPSYLKQLETYMDTEPIKVLQGIRRSGKSTILKMFKDELINRGVPSCNIFRKRFDEFGLLQPVTARQLVEELTAAMSHSDRSRIFYVFLDEIQEVDDWQTVVRGLHSENDVDVYITGSNAHLLSSDLATLLAGRTISIDVHPLSFGEYRRFVSQIDDVEQVRSNDDLFAEYVRFGGMPGLFSLRERNVESVSAELSSIYNTVILKDVAQRFEIRDVALLNRLVAYLFSTSGNLFSTRKIVGALVSGGRKASVATVENYIEALKQAFIIKEVPQFGLQGKQLLNPLRKFYPVDTGLRNMATGFTSDNVGFQLENAVANELIRRGWQVKVGALNTGEIDFVATHLDQREYFQVTETMLDESVRQRELAPLRAVHDAFAKTVLTLDRFGTGTTEDGIRVVNVIDWMLADGRPV